MYNEWPCRSCPSRHATPLVRSQHISNAQPCQHLGSWCQTLMAPCSPRIQGDLTYSQNGEGPPQTWSPPYNAYLNASSPHEVAVPLCLFMKTLKRLDKSNKIWLFVPASFHNIIPKTKSCEDNSQWNLTGMKEMSQSLLVIGTQYLRGGSAAQCAIYIRPIECQLDLLEFNL